MKILISRTDSIGDVILTLPMAGVIKQKFPHAIIYFLGKTYTKAVVDCALDVDHFIDYNLIDKLPEIEQIAYVKSLNIDWLIHVFPNKKLAKLASKAGIANRIGTAHRHFHWLSCNYLVNFSRKKSNLHESQLNLKLLKPLGITQSFELDQLSSLLPFKAKPLLANWQALLLKNQINLVLHPKSKGSAREWGLDNFSVLIDMALAQGIRIFLTGTEEEGKLFRADLLRENENLIDLSGQLTLDELISFISNTSALVAASTGPLHIAAATGIKAIGIFPPIRPMHPGRWAPLGKNIRILVNDNIQCKRCTIGDSCACMHEITPHQVLQNIVID